MSSTKIPVEMDRFWASSENKRMLQAALSDFIAHSPDIENICTFVSGVLLDDGKEQAITVKNKQFLVVEDDDLNKAVEEADLSLMQ